MQISVLIEPVPGNGYRAKGGEPFALSAEGATRGEALARLRDQIVNYGRRNFLKLPLAAGALGGLAYLGYSRRGEPERAQGAAQRKPVLDEYDDKNIKLAHRVPAGITDDELVLLKQIGLRWAR